MTGHAYTEAVQILLPSVIVTGLAASAATYLVVDSVLIGGTRDRLRAFFTSKHDLAAHRGLRAERDGDDGLLRRSNRTATAWGKAVYLIGCSWCAGAWITAILTLVLADSFDPRGLLVTWLGAWFVVGASATAIDLAGKAYDALDLWIDERRHSVMVDHEHDHYAPRAVHIPADGDEG